MILQYIHVQHSSLQTILFCQFQAYNKKFQGYKTKPTLSANQSDILSLWEVAEGALRSSPSGCGSAHLLPPPTLERTSGRLADFVYFVLFLIHI